MADNHKRIRRSFVFPEDDILSTKWFAAQQNKSVAIRILIRAYVATYGLTDVLTHSDLLPNHISKSEITDSMDDITVEENVITANNDIILKTSTEKNDGTKTMQTNQMKADREKTANEINDELLAQLLK